MLLFVRACDATQRNATLRTSSPVGRMAYLLLYPITRGKIDECAPPSPPPNPRHPTNPYRWHHARISSVAEGGGRTDRTREQPSRLGCGTPCKAERDACHAPFGMDDFSSSTQPATNHSHKEETRKERGPTKSDIATQPSPKPARFSKGPRGRTKKETILHQTHELVIFTQQKKRPVRT